MRIRGSAALRLLGLVPAICVLSSCGGGGGNGAATSRSSSDASTLLAQTFGGGQTVRSGKLQADIEINLQGSKTLPSPISFKIAGPFQSQGTKTLPQFSFTLGVGSAAQNFNAGITSTQGKAWLQFASTSYQLPDSMVSQFRSRYQSGSGTGAGGLARFGIDPRKWLTGARVVGQEQVGGAPTTHIAALVDVPKLLLDFNTLLGKAGGAVPGAPQGISAKTRDTLGRSTKSATLDVWTGAADHALRRLKVALALSVPAARQASVAGLKGGSAGFDLQLSDLNRAQQIKAPANAKPLSALVGAGGGAGLLGGRGAGGASGAAGAGAGAGAATQTNPQGVSAPKPYLDCVTKAGTDVQAIQKCQALINSR